MGLRIHGNGRVDFNSTKKLRVDCQTDIAELAIADNAVTAQKIASNAVTNAKLADDAVDSAEIADGAVDLAHMSANSVDSDQYVDGSIDTVHLSAGAATPPKIATTGIKYLKFDGKNGAGAITLTGAAVGDRVFAIFGVKGSDATMVAGGTDFESTITVVNQIQQSLAGDLSGNDYIAILLPAAA